MVVVGCDGGIGSAVPANLLIGCEASARSQSSSKLDDLVANFRQQRYCAYPDITDLRKSRR